MDRFNIYKFFSAMYAILVGGGRVIATLNTNTCFRRRATDFNKMFKSSVFDNDITD